MQLLGKVGKNELIYYIGFILNFYLVFMQISIQMIPFSMIIILLCISLFGYVILNTIYTKKEIILWGLIISFAMFFFVVRGDSNPLRIVFMIMASRNINKEAFLLFYRCILLISIAVALFFVLKGYRFLYVDDYWGLNRGYERRYLFGFDGPNRVNCIFIAIMMSTICCKYKTKTQFFQFIVLVILFLFTKSRTGLFSGLIFLLYPYFEKKLKRGKKWNRLLNIMPYFILFGIILITLIVSLEIDSDGIQRWNEVFNNRFVNLYRARELFTISPMGIDIPEDSVGGLDNSYFLSFYSWGYLLYVLYICLVVRLIVVVNKLDDSRLRGALITYIVLPFVIELIYLSSINGIYILFIVFYKEVLGVKDVRCFKKDKKNTGNKICF